MAVKELKSLLEELLETAMRKRVSYTDFLRLLATYSRPSGLDFANFYDILAMIRRLSDEVAKAPDSLPLMRQRAESLVRKGYKPLLVDCFGLPEVYEVYAKITKECGTLAVSVEPYINALALTSEFETIYRSPTMLELARALGASLYRSTDKAIHRELGEPMGLDSLLSLARLRLKRVAESLAEDAVRTRKALILSDHGYDVYHSPPDKYYLGHGRGGRLAKIAPLIIVECGSAHASL
jgi:hypothetical protein